MSGMSTKALRLGTRRSKLAMAQSGQVADAVSRVTGRPVELVEITSVSGEEHAVVVQDVRRILDAFCEDLVHPHEPELLGTANVWHLATPFRGQLHDPSTSVLDIVAALHPTAAVAGMPRDLASELLAELEPIDRGAYAGPVGWVDANGDGEFAIALRCAEITGKTARLFAGAGIVADSVPEAEVDETERKFRALLDALRWG